MGVWYTTREAVKSALDSAETARNNVQVDRAIEAASRDAEKLCHRYFYPWTGTKYFDWPDRNGSRPWRLWLGRNELVSVTGLVAGGVTIAPGDYLLEPANDGPPYSHVEINLGSSAAFASGDTHQRAIAITGVWYQLDEESVGELAANLGASTSATAAINWSTAEFGVGDVLRIDDERMTIRGRTMVDSTQNLGGPGLAANNADVTVPVTTGTAFASGQILLVGSERMLVVDVAGNNLTVKRAWDGSVIAPHTTAADIYTLTGVEVARAQLGTTLAAHSSGAAIYRHVPPGLVQAFTVAEALNTLLQEGSGYARTVRTGDAQSDASGAGLEDLRARVKRAHRRRARTAAV